MQAPPQLPQVVQQVAQAGFLGIRLEGWLTILAILIGPIIALALQRYSERRREQKDRQRAIFKELMATRAARVSTRHVEALNAIEIEFAGRHRTDKRVRQAWKLYLDHLNHGAGDEPALIAQWVDKSSGLLTDLLYEMSLALGYDFDKVALKNDVYSPKAHGKLESEETLFRQYLLELMEGKRAIWSGIFTGDRPVQMQVLMPAATVTEVKAPPPAVPAKPSDVPDLVTPVKSHVEEGTDS